jgi:hypothetical protein
MKKRENQIMDECKNRAPGSLEADAKKLKPYGWGIVDCNNSSVTAHVFTGTDSEERAEKVIKNWNESKQPTLNTNSSPKPYRVVQLFYKEGE